MKFFNNFANYNKNKNNIWEIDRNDKSKAQSFEYIVELGVDQFGQILKEDGRVNITKVVKMSSLLPSFIDEIRNEGLVEEFKNKSYG
jgi:hypothetical protein